MQDPTIVRAGSIDDWARLYGDHIPYLPSLDYTPDCYIVQVKYGGGQATFVLPGGDGKDWLDSLGGFAIMDLRAQGPQALEGRKINGLLETLLQCATDSTYKSKRKIA